MQAESSPSLPASVSARHTGWTCVVAWRNEAGGVTYRLERDGVVRYCKLDDPRAIADEVARTRWAAAHLPVAEILDHGTGWMLTRALPGVDATAPELLARPEDTVRALARGLRRFHRAPVAGCPFDFRLEAALARVRRRVAEGRVVPARDFHPEFRQLSAAEALAELERARPDREELVVCHGDYCFPNALLQSDEVTGFVDLGELGVADRWWDLAVASWSVVWNVGSAHERQFLEAYGVEPDPARTRFYRLLYAMTS